MSFTDKPSTKKKAKSSLALSWSWELFIYLLHCYYFLFFTEYTVSFLTRWNKLWRVAVTFTKGIGFSINHTLFTIIQVVHSLRRNSIAKRMVVQTQIISNIDGNPLAATYQGTFIPFSRYLFILAFLKFCMLYTKSNLLLQQWFPNSIIKLLERERERESPLIF